MKKSNFILLCFVIIFTTTFNTYSEEVGAEKHLSSLAKKFTISNENFHDSILRVVYSPLNENSLWFYSSYSGTSPIQVNVNTGEILKLSDIFGNFILTQPEYNIFTDSKNKDLIWFSYFNDFYKDSGIMSYKVSTGQKKVFTLRDYFKVNKPLKFVGSYDGRVVVFTYDHSQPVENQKFFIFNRKEGEFKHISKSELEKNRDNFEPLKPHLSELKNIKKITIGKYNYLISNKGLYKVETESKEEYLYPLNGARYMWDDVKNSVLWIGDKKGDLVRISKNKNSAIFKPVKVVEDNYNSYKTTISDIKNIQGALYKKNYNAVIEMIKSGVNPNINIDIHMINGDIEPTPLILIAVASERKDFAKVVINAPGFDPNVVYGKGLTPLALAQFLKYYDVVELLKQKGAKELPKPQFKPFKLSGKEHLGGTVLYKLVMKDEDLLRHDIDSCFLSTVQSTIDSNDKIIAWNSRKLDKTFGWGNIFLSNFSVNTGSDYPKSVLSKGDFFIIDFSIDAVPGIDIFTVWDKQEDGTLKFRTILNWGDGNAYDKPFVRDVYKYDAKSYIVLGETGGGDQGDSWGNFWIGLWTLPNELQILKKFPWGSSDEELEDFAKFRYTISEDKKSIEIRKYHKKKRWNYQVNLEELVNKARKGNHKR